VQSSGSGSARPDGADKLPSLFQPFVQVDGALTRKYEFAFGPDGKLYVAQAGPAINTLLTTSDPTVARVPPPIGPYTGGYNSSIV
jgi:hypothetical protein